MENDCKQDMLLLMHDDREAEGKTLIKGENE